MKKSLDSIRIDGARIGFRNFTGKEGKYNPDGNRTFSIFLDAPLAKTLEADGWNVRWLQPKRPEDDPQAHLSVKVNFGNYPPKIVLISKNKKSQLNEDTINLLDWAEIETVDLIVRPHVWSMNNREGVKAYLKTMYVTLVVDDFEEKYEMLPDTAADTIGGCGDCAICKGDCSNPAHL